MEVCRVFIVHSWFDLCPSRTQLHEVAFLDYKHLYFSRNTMYSPSLLKAALVFLAGSAMAHPGESHSQQPNTALGQFKGSVRRDLGACATKLSQSGLLSRNVVRRESVVAEQRRKRSIDPSTAKTRRDIITWGENPDIVNNTSHLSDAGYTPTTAESVIFANSSCALNPEGETGPYYIPGELVRSDILEDEPGVPIYLEIQLIDVATCEPIVGEYLDIWNCNSTGVYSGIMGDGNGNADDASNTKATFLRGLSPTDEDGVVTFQTLFPGHYAGRANHVHVAAHFNATLLPNNTLSGGTYDRESYIQFSKNNMISDGFSIS